MKKVVILFLMLLVVTVFTPIYQAKAALNFEGEPDTNPDHFIWSVMDQLDAPDDADCQDVVTAVLDEDGSVPLEDYDMIKEGACEGMASMKTSMQSSMNGEGEESMETNLFDAADWHNVENLYFRHLTNGQVDGQIAFSNPIDFMSYEFLNFMTTFGQNMEASEGYISLDADVVGGFANYGATLTMYNVPEFSNPEILVNGEEDDEGVVSSLVYDRENNTITFSAAHFTEFEVVEGNEEPEVDKVKVKKYFNPLVGSWRVKVKIKGDEYDESTEVTLGRREPYRISYRDKNEIVAYFSLDKLLRAGKDEFIIRVINGNETEKFDEQFKLSSLTTSYQEVE